MSVINMVENIKKVHPSVIIFYEIGTFYYTYGKDAYIISYMFDYKLRKVNNSIINFSRSNNSNTNRRKWNIN